MSYTRVSVRASQEYPIHSPNPRILARLKKIISNYSQTHLLIFWHLEKKPSLHADIYASVSSCQYDVEKKK
jgi:hypothetical protein